MKKIVKIEKVMVKGIEVNLTRSTGKVGDCLAFPHNNGNYYPVKERSNSQIEKNLKKYYGLSNEDLKRYEYLENTQMISDCNGNIYATFLQKDENGNYYKNGAGELYQANLMICRYKDYIKEVKTN